LFFVVANFCRCLIEIRKIKNKRSKLDIEVLVPLPVPVLEIVKEIVKENHTLNIL
jgi:hypothetical protein